MRRYSYKTSREQLEPGNHMQAERRIHSKWLLWKGGSVGTLSSRIVYSLRQDPWKSRTRSLPFRFRDRFRTAVNRHCRLLMFSTDGQFSSTLQRWFRRVCDFHRDLLSSSSVFYCKWVGKDIGAEEDSVFMRMLQAPVVPVIGNMQGDCWGTRGCQRNLTRPDSSFQVSIQF